MSKAISNPALAGIEEHARFIKEVQQATRIFLSRVPLPVSLICQPLGSAGTDGDFASQVREHMEVVDAQSQTVGVDTSRTR